MEQLYMIEIFIDKVSIFVPDDEDEESKSGKDKNLIVKTKFGPSTQFIIREEQLALNNQPRDDIIQCDESGKKKWSRTIRVGRSFLFPSYADSLLIILSKFPLEIEVWNDDESEKEIFVGIGTMIWDTGFYLMLKDTANPCRLHEPLSIKQTIPLFAECCCRRVGEISFILRLSALGDSITTEFQQLMSDPDTFVFRTNKAPSMFTCKRVDGENPNFCMVGSLYETATLEDPDIIANANKKIEVCTEIQSCGANAGGIDTVCEHTLDTEPKKKYPIEKIRMGDITGPCGNTNCALAQKIKTYIRNLDAYKKETTRIDMSASKINPKKICGACSCKDDRFHRETCPEFDVDEKKPICKGCGGIAQKGETCQQKVDKFYGTGLTPRGSKTDLNKKPLPTKPTSRSAPGSQTQIQYLYETQRDPKLMESLFGKNFIVENLTTEYFKELLKKEPKSSCCAQSGGCSCCNRNAQERKPQARRIPTTMSDTNVITSISTRSLGYNNPFVYNVGTDNGKRGNTPNQYNCSAPSEDKDCKCEPPVPTPPCKTFDCDCITETTNIAARKAHKPFCPCYKHKSTCPVNMMADEEENNEYEEEQAEPLPYGLPPIKLGPCPVLGRPCTIPDGFARMYKVGAQPPLPPSYTDAGKVCCSKEYERIKKAIKDYIKNEKENDFKCINKYNVDNERRCCDKEQRLLVLMGKGCCGSHKISVHEKYKEDKMWEKK